MRTNDDGGGSDPVEVLRRWQHAGGTWRVLTYTGERATVSLCRCDGGEEIERLTSNDPALLRFLADHPDSQE